MPDAPRSNESSSIAVRQPSSTAPSTSVTGTRASVKKTSPNSLAPLICLSGRASTPGWCMSISSIEMPLCRELPGSVRTIVKILSPCTALVVHTFWPLTTKSSPSRTPRVASAARSDPAPGSEKPWHQITSLRSIGPMISFFCASEPIAMTVGARKVRPSALTVRGASASTISRS